MHSPAAHVSELRPWDATLERIRRQPLEANVRLATVLEDCLSNQSGLRSSALTGDNIRIGARIAAEAVFHNLDAQGTPMKARLFAIALCTTVLTACAEEPTDFLDLCLNKGHVYSVSVSRSKANLPDGCFGCNGVPRFPIRDPVNLTTDSLRLYYSAGLPLCKGCLL